MNAPSKCSGQFGVPHGLLLSISRHGVKQHSPFCASPLFLHMMEEKGFMQMGEDIPIFLYLYYLSRISETFLDLAVAAELNLPANDIPFSRKRTEAVYAPCVPSHAFVGQCEER